MLLQINAKIFKMADSSASTSSRPSCSTEHEDDNTDTGSSESIVPVHSLSPECEETQESMGIGTTTNQGKSDVWLYFPRAQRVRVLWVIQDYGLTMDQVKAIVHDQASNMELTGRTLEEEFECENLSCAAH